jgi:hypothetical protein
VDLVIVWIKRVNLKQWTRHPWKNSPYSYKMELEDLHLNNINCLTDTDGTKEELKRVPRTDMPLLGKIFIFLMF